MKPLKPLYWDVDRWRHEGNRNPDTRPDTSDNPDIERACAFSDLVETGLRRDTADAMNAVDFDRLADHILSGVEQLETLSPKPSQVRAAFSPWVWLRGLAAAAVPLALLAALVWIFPKEPTAPAPNDLAEAPGEGCTVERIQAPFRNQTLVLRTSDEEPTTVIWVVENADGKLN